MDDTTMPTRTLEPVLSTLTVGYPYRLNVAGDWQGGYSSLPYIPPEATAQIQSALQTLQPRSEVMGPEWEDGFYTGYTVFISGDPKPGVITTDFKQKSANSIHKPWPPRNGEMYVSPRENATVSVSLSAGKSGVKTISSGYKYLKPSLFGHGTLRGDRFFISDTLFYSDVVNTGSNAMFKLTAVVTKFSWLTPSFPSASQIYTMWREANVFDKSLATSTQASANKRDVDLLTELAELPKTLAWVLDSFNVVGRMIVDLKRGRIRASMTQVIRDRRNLASYTDRLSSLKSRRDAQLRNARNARRIQTVQHRYRRDVANLERQQARIVRQSQAAYVSEIASLWLQFRYALMPIVYTAESALDIIAKSSSVYNTTRGFTFHGTDITLPPGWGDITLNTVHRCFVKHKLSLGYGKGFAFNNPFSTFYEKTPLSFVADWFINLGDVLAAYYPSLSEAEVAMYIFKCNDTVTVTNTNGAKATIKMHTYDAKVVDMLEIGGICFEPTMDLFRYFDAAALSWQRSKNSILRYRN